MPLRRVLLLVQLPLWCLLLASFAFLLRALDARVEATTQAAQTRIQIETMSGLLLHVLDMETGVRGYVIAGNDVFLEPYREAVRALPGDFRLLRTQLGSDVSSGPERARNLATVDHLELLVTRWQTEVGRPEIAARQRSAQAAAAIVISQRGRKLLDAVRTDIQTLTTRQTARLQQLETRAVRQLRVLRQALYGACAAIGVLSLLTALAGADVLTRRLDALTGAARRLTGGESRITVPARGPRELRTLAQTFNAMSERLHVVRQEADDAAADLAQRNDWMRRMGRLSDAMQAARSMDEGAGVLERALPALLPGTRGVLTTTADGRAAPLVAWGGAVPQTMPEACWALRRGEVQSPEQREFAPPCPGGRGGYLCVPLLARGEPLGLLRVEALPDGGPLPPALAALVPGVGRQVALALASLELQERLLQQSIRDPLTGLYNRRRLDEELTRLVPVAARDDTPLSVIALDIDHFKRLNDTHGHDAGDAALVQVSAVLRDLAPPGSTCARPGGEEFTLLLPGFTLDAAEALAERVRRAVAGLILTHGDRVLGPVTVSLGVADSAARPLTPASLTSAADQALYAAKHRGRDRVVTTRALRSAARGGDPVAGPA